VGGLGRQQAQRSRGGVDQHCHLALDPASGIS
jgi:hypothetical protein